MVAPGDQRGTRWRAQRRGVEVGIPQPGLRDPIHRRCRNHAAEGARRAEPAVVGHDQQHVGRALRRHDAWCPPLLRFRRFLLDHPAELGIGRRQLPAVEGRRGARRTQRTGDLLCGNRMSPPAPSAPVRRQLSFVAFGHVHREPNFVQNRQYARVNRSANCARSNAHSLQCGHEATSWSWTYLQLPNRTASRLNSRLWCPRSSRSMTQPSEGHCACLELSAKCD